jgi:transcriptional regulator with GAF, ATPase, and Fis domain
LFLDEVGELPLEHQGKLTRVGEGRTRFTDVRIIAATNRDLPREVERGGFREDLYYRLNIFSIDVPPLRERKSDIPSLAVHLIAHIARRARKPPIALSAAHLEWLQSYDWPGNVRELRNVLERAQVSSGADDLRLVLPRGPRPSRPAPSEPRPSSAPRASEPCPLRTREGSGVLREADLRERERANLLAALERSGGRIYGPSGAAALLGLKPTTLASRIKKLNLVVSRRSRWG